MVVQYDNMSEESAKETMVSKCCCRIPLSIGCFILGYFTLILNLVHTYDVVSEMIFMGQLTKGFSTLEAFTPAPDEVDHEAPVDTDDAVVVQVVAWIMAIVVLCELIWLAINIACLVGLHKKKPGPVKAYVAFATIRLIFTTISYLYGMKTDDDEYADNIFILCIGFGLNAYFIMVYYIYAMKLQKEIQQKKIDKASESQVNDIVHIYPTNLDKQYLVA